MGLNEKLVTSFTTASGFGTTGPAILKSLHWTSTGAAGNVTLRAGTSSSTGAIKMKVGIAGVAEADQLTFSSGGFEFDKKVHLTLPGSNKITLFYLNTT